MIIEGDAIEELQKLKENSIDTIFTSPNPPLHLEKVDSAIVGGEANTKDYIIHLAVICEHAKRVLKSSGSLFVEMGDYYDSITHSLRLVPFAFAQTMQLNGWCIRNVLHWKRTEKIDPRYLNKTKFRKDVEYLFWFVKNPKKTYFNYKNNEYWKTSVFEFPYYQDPKLFDSGFPKGLIKIIIETTVPKHGIILDPLAGTGTVGEVAKKLHRKFILIDINPKMVEGMRMKLYPNSYTNEDFK